MLTIVGLAWKAFNVEVFKAQLLPPIHQILENCHSQAITNYQINH